MNFSRFEYLASQSDYLSQCVKHCKAAERAARWQPKEAAIAARGAIDQLFIHLSKENKVRPVNLADSIKKNCDVITENSNAIRVMADHIRSVGNDATHGNYKKGKEIDAATKANIQLALDLCRELYELLSALFGKPEEFDEGEVPFQDFQIKRPVMDGSILDRENYFVTKEADGYTEYCYLQCLSILEEVALEARRKEASKLIYNRHNRNSRLLLANMQMFLPENSDRKILIYNAYSDSIMLSELNRKMKPKEALRLGLDLCEALEELKQLGMYHRNLYPGCVLLDTLDDGSYAPYLLNLQTSKILGSDTTVNERLAAAWDCNFYIPESLRNGGQKQEQNNLAAEDWERVDAYSVCRTVLFCMDRQWALTTTTTTLTGYNNEHPDAPLPDCLISLYKQLFMANRPVRTLPNLTKVKEVFENAYDQCK